MVYIFLSWYPRPEGGPIRVPQKMLPTESKYIFFFPYSVRLCVCVCATPLHVCVLARQVRYFAIYRTFVIH